MIKSHITLVAVLAASASAFFACDASDEGPTSAGELALDDSGSDLQGSGACAALAQIDEDCPPDLEWDNHGQYVSCVSRYVEARVASGDLSEQQAGALVSVAARSSVGKPTHENAKTKSRKDKHHGKDGWYGGGGGGGCGGQDSPPGGWAGVGGSDDSGEAGSAGESANGGSAGSDQTSYAGAGTGTDQGSAGAANGGKPDWSAAAGENCP